MKNFSLTLGLVVCFIGGVFGQPYHEWSYGFGDIGTEQGRAITSDDSGNSYVVGRFGGTIDFDPGAGTFNLTSNGSSDVYIQKLSNSGDLIWAKSIGGSGSDYGVTVDLDPSGNLLIGGYFTQTADFDPGVGTFNLTSAGLYDGFALKLDPNGDFIWAQQFGGTDDDKVLSIAADGNGNVICGGEFKGTADFDPGTGTSNLTSAGLRDLFILKLSSTGTLDWAHGTGSTGSEMVNGVDVDGSNNIILAGAFQNSIDFDYGAGSHSLSSSGNYDAFIQKLDPSGAHTWTKKLGGSGSDFALTVEVDVNDNAIVGGHFAGSGFFGSSTLTSNGFSDIFVTKFNPNGGGSWTKSIGGSLNESLKSLSINDAGEVYMTGVFQSTVDFDPNGGTYNMTGLAGEDIFISKLSASGSFGWARQISSGLGDESGNAISVSGTNIFCTGYFDTEIDLDPTAGVNSVTPVNNFDAFVIRLNECLTTYSTINPTVCSSYTSPSGNYTWTTSNTYSDTIPNSIGCDSVITINLTVEDVTAPVADAASLSDIVTTCGQPVTALTPPTATDNCTGAITGTTSTTLPITSSTTLTWTFDDGNGNTSTQTQNVIINMDVTAPVEDAASLSDIVTTCGQPVNALTPPTATDDCAGAITGTTGTTLPITSSTTLTWTYDDGNGNTSTQTQNVIVNMDATAPVADAGSLSNINETCSVASLIAPTATDDCSGTITGTHDATLPITSQGTTVVTWTYDDGNGNTSTQTQNVIITDITAPVFDMATLADVTAECEVTSLTAPTATDNCAGAVTGSHDATLPITSQGTTVVTWTYDDGNGNTSTQTQNIVIADVSAPVADVAMLPDVTAECEVTSLIAPTATDNCSGSVAASHNASLPITSQGTVVVTWTYDDGNGNTSTQTQNVIIDDVTAPSADLANLPEITDECEVTPTAPAATDNCAGAITGTPDVTFPITTSGTTTITWTYDDGNGNISSQTQDVTITPINVSTTTTENESDYTITADATGYTYQWIENCGTSNDVISGATNIDYTPASNGVYAVIIDNGSCSDTSECVVIDDLSVFTNELGNTFKVYPNPTNGNVSIEFSEHMDGGNLKVMNAVGQVVQEQSFQNLQKISTVLEGEPGVYIIQITTENKEASRLNIIKY